jgi:hypothetical protein
MPGSAAGAPAVTEFSLRPFQLLAGEELAEAVVRVEVLAPAAFAGSVLAPAGGSLNDGDLGVTASAGDFARPEAAVLRRLNIADASGLVPAGLTLAGAFELSVASPAAGRALGVQLGTVAPGGSFVLARAVFDEGRHGFQPVLRFASDATGGLTSLEPAAGERLAGVDGGGQFWLFQTAKANGLIGGVVRDRSGSAVAGAVVRTGPWTAFSDAAGRYQLVAPAGSTEVSVLDPRTEDSGTAAVTVETTLAAVSANVETAQRGPRVVTASPAEGAVNVARVAAVTLTFNRPLNPATLLGDAVKFTDASGAAIPAGPPTLNLARTALTMLPTAQLPASSQLTVTLAATVADLAGRPLEGPREFRFTTESEVLRRSDAELTIFEPVNGLAPMVGGPGMAEPDSPVIFVNDTTGFSSTVLSKSDGSFTNSIPADVDDFLSVVLVNRNGTRNTVPASRQVFRDGRVGLYSGGGLLQASVEDSSVELEIVSGSIRDKAVFKLEAFSLDEVQALTRPTPLRDGQALTGFRFQVTGGELLEPARVRMPVSPNAVKLPAGARSEDMAFVLTRTTEVDGVSVYEAVDTARYVDGHLETEGRLAGLREGSAMDPGGSSPGRPAVRAGRQPRRAFVGVYLGVFVFQQLFDVVHANFSVAGGVVQGHRSDLGISSIDRVEGAAVFFVRDATKVGIVPGDRVAFSARDGTFRLPIGLGLIGAGEEVITVGATSQQFATFVPVKSEPIVRGKTFYRIDLDFFGGNGVNNKDSAGDREAPVVSVSHSPAGPPLDQIATLRVFANDDKQLTGLSVVLAGVQPLDAGVPVVPGDVTLTEDPGSKVSVQTIQRSFGIKASKPLTARFEVTAKDAADHTSTIAYSVVFGGPQPPADPPSDPTDKTGPFVTRSVPVQDSEGVLPGQVIRLDFSEPVNGLFSPYQPDQVFQLSPAAGPVVARLADDRRSVELTCYALQPDTLYSLTVNPLLSDVNGNRFDQNPYNNPPADPGSAAEAFLLRFRTAPLTPVALPGVVNGVGVLARGRQLIVLDRVTATQGALHFYDAADPSQPTVQFSIPVPAFPRAFTLVPRYSYRRLPGAPVETSDLVVAAGGTLGGGGQWLRVFALPPTGTPQTLVATTLSPSPAAAVTKLQWSAPLLGYLEADADSTSVGLLNLQLAIIADHQSPAQFDANPAEGARGLDANGDGDFVDEGDKLPLPLSALRRLGVINGGKVATFELGAPFRQRDFDLQFGGNFLGALESASASELDTRYRTLAVGGLPPASTGASTLFIRPEGKRLTLLFGQALDTLGGVIVANLALVSQHAGPDTPPRLLVLDVTDPLQPQVVNEIRIPAAHGIPQTIRQREDGLLVLSTTTDLLLLDPRKLRLVPETFAQPHPAIVGLVPGFGGGAMQFVSAPDGFTASAVGGVARVAGPPSRVDLTLHRPGTLSAPGPAVGESQEGRPDEVLVFVNDDADGNRSGTPIGSAGSLPDFSRNPRSILDNELLALRIGRLPENPGVPAPSQVELRISIPGASGATNPAAQLIDPLGSVIRATATNGTTLVIRHALDDPSSPFGSLRREAVTVFAEAVRPSADVQVELEVFDSLGRSLGSDSVHFVALRASMVSVWSEQFDGSRSNELPSNSGEASSDFLVMGNTANGVTKVGARVILEPDIPAARSRLQARLFVPHERRFIGTSFWAGEEVHVEASDDRAFPRGFPLLPILFTFQLTAPLDVEEVLMVGFDHDRDGILTEAEMPVGFGTRSQSGRIDIIPAEPLDGIGNPHIKVFPKELYDREDQPSLTFLAGVSGYLGLPGSMADLIVEAIGVELPVTLIGGLDPVSALAPIAAVRLANFFSGSSAVGNPFLWPTSVDEYDFPDKQRLPFIGHQAMAHQTGKFTGGFRRLKRFNHDRDHFISRTIAESRSFQNSVVGIVAVRQPVKDAIRTALGAGSDFVASISLTRESAPAGPENGLMSVAFTHTAATKDFDLEYGIGNASILRIELEIEGRSKILPDGRAGVEVTRTHFKATVEDIYDWAWGDNPFGVILEAGHSAYGTRAGAPYIQRYEVEGDVMEPIDTAL